MLTEFAPAAIIPTPTSGGLADHVIDSARDFPDRIVMSVPSESGWSGISARQFLDRVRAVAKGLIANGIEPGQRVGVMSRTRYEWTVVDYAIWYAGATSVPVYETSSAEQVRWILSDSGAVAVFLESHRNKAVFEQVAVDLPETTRVWVFDDGALDMLADAGARISDGELEARRATVSPDSLATIIYTSGTTGMPKGCMLTHRNCMAEVENVIHGLPDVFLVEGSSTLLFLPIAHVFGRMIELGCVRAGVRLGHAPDISQLLPLLQSFQPTFLLAVPRVFEKVFNGAQQKSAAEGKGRIFDTAARVAIEYSQAVSTGHVGVSLRVQHAIFDRLVYGKLRTAMGGHLEWAVSGGAPLGARLGHFFRGIGVTILEGYGLTETTAASTVNRPSAIRIGTVGQPIPGSSVRIAEDGEILLAGDHVFVGYWNNPQATAESIDEGGWFHSGDLGTIDDDGFLSITGRKKEILVTAGGKNVAPAVLEDRLKANWLISQCMVVGDGQPFIAALVTIDPESWPTWLRQSNLPAGTTVAQMVDDDRLTAFVQHAVDEANKAVSHAEAIKKFTILPHDWTEEGGQMTPSLKIKRRIVMQEHAGDVAALYGAG